ncbi:hypothetical protein [Staphylococcus equorum]|uniref:hypothetical protein n=1 Tax=Staphylococcus equorum TaxID=246432 RepID=UPI000853C5AD|nr:hypothetical protein [Staphylococcus equorum]OEK68684.1 hypothetical protein AST02_08615 [Staphylococcus equorum]
MKSTNQNRANLVVDNLLNKETYFSISTFWILLMLRNLFVHGTSHFQFDANIFFELCFFLVPTAFISSNKIMKNTNVKDIFNKNVTSFLIFICLVFTIVGISGIAISNYYIPWSLVALPINMVGLLFIICGLFIFWVMVQIKYLVNENI